MSRGIPLGAVVAALLGLAFGYVLATYWDTGEEGATASALEEAFNFSLGVAGGLLIGSAFAASASPRRRILSGIAAGLAAYVVILTPAYVLTAPDGVSAIAALGTMAFLLPLAAIVSALGALFGRFADTLARRRRTSAQE